MSNFHMKKAKCPDCGGNVEIKMWKSVNVDINSEEKEKILSGKFYEVECPHCHETVNYVYDFLYHDMEHQYMISVCNDYTDAIKSVGIPRNYKLRRVDNIQELVEKIRIFDYGLNDIVIEEMKQIINGLSKANYDLMFVEIKDGRMIFEIMNDSTHGVAVDKILYNITLETCRVGELTERYSFMRVDQKYINELAETS